jgi:adenylate cyclase
VGSQSSINIPKAEDISSIIRKSQARVSKALVGKPQFFLSNVETQDTLKLFAKNKTNLVILNVDLVASTKLSMTLSLDRLAMIIQAFNQEMSLVIKEFGGYILKYVGDAVLAFFFVPEDQSEKRYSVVNALNCAKCMIQVVLKAMNTVLAKHD